jgi:hypothetical protein
LFFPAIHTKINKGSLLKKKLAGDQERPSRDQKHKAKERAKKTYQFQYC